MIEVKRCLLSKRIWIIEYIFYFLGKTLVVQGDPGGGKTFQFPQLNLNQWSNLVMTRDASNNMSIYLCTIKGND